MRLLALVIALIILSVGGIAFTQIQTGAVPTGPAVSLELIAEDLTSPVALKEPPDGSGRLFIVDQVGQIWILMPDGTMLDEPFLDLSDQIVDLNPSFDERGLLGLAFHPQYAENGHFYVYYSAPPPEPAPEGNEVINNVSHISEFTVFITDTNKADPTSEQILLQVDQPQFNHNGGTLEFGPDDDYLYISLGDGGGGGDDDEGHVDDWYEVNDGGNGQDIEANLLGSILRIDVDPIVVTDTLLYGIPSSNPFTMTFPITAPVELQTQWAYGFRNPFRFSFDMQAPHNMYVGDAGQELWEEVSLVETGGNYGWNVKEGTHCFSTADPDNSLPDCPDNVGMNHPDEGAPLIDPIIEFANSKQEGGLGLTVIGGHVYRGDTLHDMNGDYFFGVWSQGEDAAGDNLPGDIFVSDTAQAGTTGLWSFQEVFIANGPNGDVPGFLLSFGQDQDGEVYVLTTDNVGPEGNTGKVYRIVTPTFNVYMPVILKPEE